MNKLHLKYLFFQSVSVGLIKDTSYLSMPILPTPPTHDSEKLGDTTSLPHKCQLVEVTTWPASYEAAAL